jgi:hypothetical protein
MDILEKDGTACFDLKYPISHNSSWLRTEAKKGYKTYMVAVVCDRLSDEHWDDPVYMHKTNHIIISKAREEARRTLMSHYFSAEEMAALFEKHSMPTWEFNFQEEIERKFKFRLEDALFEYQEMKEVVLIMQSVLDDCKYKVDEEGYALENEDGDYTLEEDPKAIEKQKEKALEDYLIPRVQTTYDRVYKMPEPFNHWDYRSAFHQGFFVEVDGITYVDMGGSGSSGRRESNGRWTHTFGLLANKYNIETPSFFMRYYKHNVFKEEFRLDTFATIGRDLSGNYQSTREIMEPLFKGRIYDMVHPEKDSYDYSYIKREDDLYY